MEDVVAEAKAEIEQEHAAHAQAMVTATVLCCPSLAPKQAP